MSVSNPQGFIKPILGIIKSKLNLLEEQHHPRLASEEFNSKPKKPFE